MQKKIDIVLAVVYGILATISLFAAIATRTQLNLWLGVLVFSILAILQLPQVKKPKLLSYFLYGLGLAIALC